MHARQSVTSLCETEPAGNSEKSSTSRACFAFAPFDAEGFRDAFAATAVLLAAGSFFDADFFDAFFAAAFLPPASLFTFDATALFIFGAAAFAFAAGFAFEVGFAFFAVVFDLLLVAAIQSAPMETS